MGRHRSDPRGLARILIAAIAVVLALALVVVGGMALVNALTSSPEKPGPSTGPASPGGKEPGGASPPRTGKASATASSVAPLVIRVVGGQPVEVTVTVPGTSEVLQRGALNPGEARTFDRAPLNLVASNGSSVQVTIYGKVKAGTAGQRSEWFVPEQ